MTDVNYRDLASRWWVQAATPELNTRVRNKRIIDAIFNTADLMGSNTDGLKDYLKQLSPRKSKTDPEGLAYFDNSYKYANDRLTKIGPGRFIKKLFPDAPDHLVEGFTMWWKDNIAFDKSNYKLHVGKTREDFKRAFTKRRNTSNLYYKNLRKSISDSCMRYAFSNLPCHPSEVYASGDFEVVAVRDNRGKTRARCVVRVRLLDDSPCFVPGWIYTSDNYSAELIEGYLESKKEGSSISIYEDYHWHEARILNIPYSEGSEHVVCPYVDNNRYLTRYNEDFNLLVNGVGNYYSECNNTSGCTYIPKSERYNYKYKKPK